MSLREYKLAVVREAWPRRYEPTKLIEYLRNKPDDIALDAVLTALGHDPATLRTPLPNPTLIEEMDGGA